jgi:ATP-binding cassette subfamily B protein
MSSTITDTPPIHVATFATLDSFGPRSARIDPAIARGRTSFVVAHRLSTIRHANQVLVLDHGRIVERGTHQELLSHGGVYTALYRRFASHAA